jgi:hypothetical protein
MIVRRLDTSPNPLCQSTSACPAFFELDDGNFAIIGATATEKIKPHLPDGSGCADHEAIIKVPRSVFLDAVKNAAKSTNQ